MNKLKSMKKARTPLQPYSQERQDWWERTQLEMYRKILGNPNMSVQEMREMDNRKQENTTEVTFLKLKKG